MRAIDRFAAVLRPLVEYYDEQGEDNYMSNQELQEATDFPVADLNDIVALLVERGLVDWLRTLGTAPYAFSHARSTPRGRFEFRRSTEPATDERTPRPTFPQQVDPIGSPFGFTDQDWELVATRKGDPETLRVILGLQFASAHYDTRELRANVQEMFRMALQSYSGRPDALPAQLDFSLLQAGYGEHLFNEIARDIISADIAVFETSDLNANVMVEMGVALTWGVRVLPIKLQGRPEPPSDISGQTWADYVDNAAEFVDPEHREKLCRMVARAVGKKARG